MNKNLFNLFLIFLAFLSQPAYSQYNKTSIFFADSLFEAGNFSDALSSYEELENSGTKIPNYILARLAFLEERSGNAASALYYHSILMKKKPNTKILSRLDLLASENKLKGFEYTDIDYFLYLYSRYRYIPATALLLSGIVLFLYLLTKILKKENLKLRPAVMIAWVILTYVLLNYEFIPQRAIITRNNTYLMTAPSAGASLSEVIEAGHRITIKEKSDVWYKINWNDKDVYVNENNLVLIK